MTGAPEVAAPTTTNTVSERSGPPGAYFVAAERSYLIIGTYVFLLVVVLLILPTSPVVIYSWLPWFIAAVIAFFLARYLSTAYWIDEGRLSAFRILGGRHLRLEEIRRIQFASLRDLSPTGFFGSWGYRGRMWSPVIGKFDTVHTSSLGVLLSAGEVPLFISPKNPQDFARELSRRVRSYRGGLEVDDGAPESTPPPID